MAIYIDNANDVTLSDSGAVLSTTFIKVFFYSCEDTRLDNLTVVAQYGVYLDVLKWFNDWRGNKLRVEGLPLNRSLTLDYSRTNDGPDLEQFIYDAVKADLLAFFPSWVPADVVIVNT